MVPFRKATECRIHVSGGEFNVAANLANCFGLSSGMVSAMVDYPIGDLIAERVRAMGVQPFYKWFEHDGVTGPNMAAVYSDRGFGVRPPVVFYNRSNEAAARLKSGDFDWKTIFAGGVRWFHSGGIFAALSETTPELIVDAMRAAKQVGAVVSFDLNFREKLWKALGGQDRAISRIGRIVDCVDVLLGGEDDLQKILGIVEPDVKAKSGLDPGKFLRYVAHRADNPFYRDARFCSAREVRTLLRKTGFADLTWVQTLYTPLSRMKGVEPVSTGTGQGAFLVVRARRP